MQRPSKPARALATNSVMIGLRVAIDHRRTARGAVLFLQGGDLQAGGSVASVQASPRKAFEPAPKPALWYRRLISAR